MIEADNEERAVDDVETLGVVGAFIPGDDIAEAGPDLAILSGKYADGSFGSFLDRYLLSIVNNSLQIFSNVVLCHDEVMIIVEGVEPVKLTAANDNYVF